MAEWVDNLKSKRAQLLEPSALPGSKRAARVLTRMRAGTLDWRATLDARAHDRNRGDAARRGAASRLGVWQRRVVTQLDELLLRAGEALAPHQTLPAPADPLPPLLDPEETSLAPEETSSDTEATAAYVAKPKKRASAKRAASPKPKPVPDSSALPIEGYTKLTAKQVLVQIRGLDDEARAEIRAFESAHKARKTVLRALS